MMQVVQVAAMIITMVAGPPILLFGLALREQRQRSGS